MRFRILTRVVNKQKAGGSPGQAYINLQLSERCPTDDFNR